MTASQLLAQSAKTNDMTDNFVPVRSEVRNQDQAQSIAKAGALLRATLDAGDRLRRQEFCLRVSPQYPSYLIHD